MSHRLTVRVRLTLLVLLGVISIKTIKTVSIDDWQAKATTTAIQNILLLLRTGARGPLVQNGTN